jgi:hypothetical protein
VAPPAQGAATVRPGRRPESATGHKDPRRQDRADYTTSVRLSGGQLGNQTKGLGQVHLPGFSIGSFVAQQIALVRPVSITDSSKRYARDDHPCITRYARYSADSGVG